MTMDQATRVAIDCIRRAANFSGPIRAQDTLSGLNAAGAIPALKDCIVNVGVPRFQHTLDVNHLADMRGSWTVTVLVARIQANAVRDAGNLRPAHVRAAEAIARIGGGQ